MWQKIARSNQGIFRSRGVELFLGQALKNKRRNNEFEKGLSGKIEIGGWTGRLVLSVLQSFFLPSSSNEKEGSAIVAPNGKTKFEERNRLNGLDYRREGKNNMKPIHLRFANKEHKEEFSYLCPDGGNWILKHKSTGQFLCIKKAPKLVGKRYATAYGVLEASVSPPCGFLWVKIKGIRWNRNWMRR